MITSLDDKHCVFNRVLKAGRKKGSIPWIDRLPNSPVVKESSCNAGDPSSTPGSRRSTGEGIGYALQCSRATLWLSWQRICLQYGRPGFDPWFRKMPWRRNRTRSRELHGLCSPWGRRESDTTGPLSLSPGSTVQRSSLVSRRWCDVCLLAQSPLTRQAQRRRSLTAWAGREQSGRGNGCRDRGLTGNRGDLGTRNGPGAEGPPGRGRGTLTAKKVIGGGD